jgi:hypothetical protein
VKQSLLERAVARATGEALFTIRSRGFSIFDPTGPHDELDALPRPQTVDWDQLRCSHIADLRFGWNVGKGKTLP